MTPVELSNGRRAAALADVVACLDRPVLLRPGALARAQIERLVPLAQAPRSAAPPAHADEPPIAPGGLVAPRASVTRVRACPSLPEMGHPACVCGSDRGVHAMPVARAAFFATRFSPAPVLRIVRFAAFTTFFVLDFLRLAILFPPVRYLVGPSPRLWIRIWKLSRWRGPRPLVVASASGR